MSSIPVVERYQFEMPWVVAVEETDEVGHVNNTVYLQHAEAVARAHSDSTGLTWEKYQELGGYFVVRRHVITYHKPAFPGEALTLRTRVADSHGPRSRRIVHIYRGAELLVDVDTEWIWVLADSGRPARRPEEVLRRLPPME